MIVFAALLLATLQAQPAGAPLCKPTSTTLTNGVVVAVRSVGGNNPDLACEVSVRDRNGRTVFNDRGFDTAIHPATGATSTMTDVRTSSLGWTRAATIAAAGNTL